MDLSLRYLQTFVEVAAQGSISLAARRLHIAQPAVSRQMKLLEEQVGCTLLQRGPHGVRLTALGARLRDAAVGAFRQIDEQVAALQGHGDRPPLRIGALTEIGQSYVLPHLLRFQSQGPAFSLNMHYAKEFELKQQLQEGQLDAIVVTSAVDGHKALAIQDERSVLVTRAANATDINDAMAISSHPFVCYREGDPLLGAYLQSFYPDIAVETLDVVAAVNSHRSMLDILVRLDAYAVMPWQSVAEHISARLIRVASERELRGEIYLVCTPKWAESRLGNALLSYFLNRQ